MDNKLNLSKNNSYSIVVKNKSEIWKNKSYYLMMLPAALIFSLFTYLPMPGIIIAFKNYNYQDGIFGSPFVGLNNFKFFFKSSYALRTTLNTVWINFNNILWGTIVAVVFALILNEIREKKAVRVYQNLMFLPYFFSAIVVGKLVGMMFSDQYGVVNQVLKSFHFHDIQWYETAKYWVKILVGTSIWKGTGYSVIIYLSTITGIDEELFEASSLDGASRWQQIRYVLVPLLIPTIVILTLLNIGRIFFGDFGLIYSVVGDNGLLMPKTDVIETFVFRSVRQSAEFSMSAAVGLYQSIVGFILVFVSNMLAKLYDEDYSLF